LQCCYSNCSCKKEWNLCQIGILIQLVDSESPPFWLLASQNGIVLWLSTSGMHNLEWNWTGYNTIAILPYTISLKIQVLICIFLASGNKIPPSFLVAMKWSMDHVLTGVVWVKKANCYNIAVYCHVVLDEGERRILSCCVGWGRKTKERFFVFSRLIEM
jgi:hypothetical protein